MKYISHSLIKVYLAQIPGLDVKAKKDLLFWEPYLELSFV